MSINYSAFFVPVNGDEDLQKIHQVHHPEAEIFPDTSFARLWFSDDMPWGNEPYTLSLSKAFGEAFLIMEDGMTDVFWYEHSRDGVIVRELRYDSPDAGWSRVVGEPEPWEEGLLFSEARLEQALRVARWAPEDERARKEARLREMWAERRLDLGSPDPRYSETDGLAVARLCGFKVGLGILNW